MEGKNDPSAGRDVDGETSVTSAPSLLAGATRATPPAQRFTSFGDAHSAITAGRRHASGGNTSVAPVDDSHESNDMPNSSSGFNPALATGGDANVDEPDDTTVARIVDQYLPSASATATERSTSIPDNATSSSGFNPALAHGNPSSIRIVAASPSSDGPVDASRQAYASGPVGREGAITRFGFRENDSSASSEICPPSNTGQSGLHNTPFTLPGPPEAPLPSLAEDFERTVFGRDDGPVSLLQSTASVTNSEDLLRSIRYDYQVDQGAIADLSDHDDEESLKVSPLNLRVMNPDPELPASSTQTTEPDPFSDHPFGRTIDRTSNSGISGSDSQHHPFEYDEPPYRCFLRRSNELSVSQYLQNQTSDALSSASCLAHVNADGTTSPRRDESHVPLPPLPPIPQFPMIDMPGIPRRATTLSDCETQTGANQVRVPIHSMRGQSESRNAATYIREQTGIHDDNYFTYPTRAIGIDGGDWMTEPTTGGFTSNRAFASSDLQSPLERIGRRAGSSLANTSDVGYNDELDLPMGARQGFSSNERILPTAPLAHIRGRSRGRTLRETGRDIVFEPRPRLHRINGYLQDSLRTFHGASPRDSGPFGAASRAFTSGLSSNPYMKLERSNRFDFHDEDSADFGNEKETTSPTQAKEEQEEAKESRYATINRDDDEQWTEVPLGDSTTADQGRGRGHDYSIIHTGPQSPIYLECPLIGRNEFARRQAIKRASGEEDQTFLDSAGRKLSNPSSVLLRRRHQELQNPFDTAESIQSQPVNANGTHSIEMNRLTRQGRRNYPYPSQIQAGPLPTMVPIDERRQWFSQTGNFDISPNYPIDPRTGIPTWAILRHRKWFVLMLIGSMVIPFFWTLIYTRIHGQALSWFTSGQAKDFTVNERMAIGICGIINLLVCVVIAGILALMAHNGTLY